MNIEIAIPDGASGRTTMEAYCGEESYAGVSDADLRKKVEQRVADDFWSRVTANRRSVRTREAEKEVQELRVQAAADAGVSVAVEEEEPV